MKYVKGWEEEKDDYVLFASPAKKKGHKKSLKDDVAIVESLDTKQQIVPTRKVIKNRALKTNLKKTRHKNLKRTVQDRYVKNLDAIIVVNWVILLGTARNHTKMLILLEKMSKTGNSPN